MSALTAGKASHPYRRRRIPHAALAAAGIALLLGAGPLAAQSSGPSAQAPADSGKPLPPEQLDALVAPVALYPDDLLAQTLAAATYPLEVIQLQQWLAKHPDLKDKALADSVSRQPWDPSIQSMAPLPEVVKRLADDIQWTTELGNAFLSQPKDVAAAVQRMRAKAKDKGTLSTTEQQKVATQTVDKQQVIVIESQNPEVVYVPSYSPTVVYGPPVYPYPPIYYPPYPPGGMFLSFTVGMMWGAAIWGGACCHMGWHGGGTVIINNNNHFNNINTGGGRGGNWEHRPEHRGGAPYGDRRTADKFGGSTRDAPRASDRGGAGAGNRAAGPGVSDRASGAGQGQRGAGVSDRGTGGIGERAGGAAPGVSDRAGGAGQAGAGVSDRGTGGIGQQPSAGTRDVGAGSRGSGGSGLSGGSRGYDGASARANSARGASSYGGGGMRGGGMGGGRGGGGGRRR